MDSKPAPSSAFRASEWLALFPQPVPGTAEPSALASAAARSVDPGPFPTLWRDHPLPKREFQAFLRSNFPFHARVYAAQAAAAPWSAKVLLRHVLASSCVLAASLVGIWIFQAATAGTRQKVAGTVGIVVNAAVTLAILVVGRGFAGVAGRAGREDQSANELSTLVRYVELEREGSALLDHKDRDRECPCPACLGGPAARYFGWFALVMLCLFWFSRFSEAWNPVVASAGDFWSRWWGALLGTLAVLFSVNQAVFSNVPIIYVYSIPLPRIGRKLRLRAVTVVLSRLLEAAELDLADVVPAETTAAVARSAQPELELHACLAAYWESRRTSWETWAPTFFTDTFKALFAIATNLAAGNCIPAYSLFLLAWVGSSLLWGLGTYAASNAEINEASRAFADGALLLSRIIASASAGGAKDPALIQKWRDKLAALTIAADGSRYRTRFAGFAVDFGTIRTLVVTAFTVGVGLFGILRPLGVSVTMNAACSS